MAITFIAVSVSHTEPNTEAILRRTLRDSLSRSQSYALFMLTVNCLQNKRWTCLHYKRLISISITKCLKIQNWLKVNAGFHKAGFSKNNINKTLGFAKTTITRTIQKYRDGESTKTAPRSGRPRSIDNKAEHELKQIIKNAKKHQFSCLMKNLEKRLAFKFLTALS